MDSSYFISSNIRMSLVSHRHRLACRSQKMYARWKRPFRVGMNWKIDSPIGSLVPSHYKFNYRKSWATYHTAHFKPLFYQITPFPAIPMHSIRMKGFPPISPSAFDLSALFKDATASEPLAVGLFSMGRRLQLWDVQQSIILETLVSRIMDYFFCYLSSTRKMVSTGGPVFSQNYRTSCGGLLYNSDLIRKKTNCNTGLFS